MKLLLAPTKLLKDKRIQVEEERLKCDVCCEWTLMIIKHQIYLSTIVIKHQIYHSTIA
jgi:hypothetical protein